MGWSSGSGDDACQYLFYNTCGAGRAMPHGAPTPRGRPWDIAVPATCVLSGPQCSPCREKMAYQHIHCAPPQGVHGFPYSRQLKGVGLLLCEERAPSL